MWIAIFLTLITVIISYVYYEQKNQRKFTLAAKFPGPKKLPLIGNAHLLIGTSKQGCDYKFKPFIGSLIQS